MALYTFPLKGKAPLTKNGLYDARPDAEWDESEYAAHKEWGMPCGATTGVFAVDVDKKKDGLATAAQFEWPATYRQDTPGGGYHLFYAYTKECEGIGNAVDALPGIDIRTDGGYVVLYKKPELEALAPPPEWLLALLRKPKASPLDFEDDSVVEGGRNNWLTRAAGRLQGNGVLTLASLKELNERKCVPPLPDAEVEQVFVSVSRYAPDSTPEHDPVPPRRVVWANEMVGDFLEYIRNKGAVSGKATGIPELDKLLGGGKRLGELTVTLAQGKTGKNTLYHQLMLPWLNEGTPIGYCSREISPETEVLPNLLTLALGKNLYKAKNITEEEIAGAIKNWRLAFSAGYGPMLHGEVFAWMDELRAHDVSYFFLDHLHYMMPDSEDYQAAAQFVRELKGYAKKHSIHIDLIIQPKVQEAGTRLGLSSMRGGAALGQTLDNLITMERQRDEAGDLIDVVKVSMEAARSKLAKTGHFFLQYNKEDMTFVVVEPDYGDTAQPSTMMPQKAPQVAPHSTQYEAPRRPTPPGIPTREQVFGKTLQQAVDIVKKVRAPE